jgi:hypothetical protein
MEEAPAEVRALVSRAQAAEAASRAVMIADLVACQKTFTQEQLTAKSTEEVQQIYALAKSFTGEEAQTTVTDFGFMAAAPRAAQVVPAYVTNPPDGWALALGKKN